MWGKYINKNKKGKSRLMEFASAGRRSTGGVVARAMLNQSNPNYWFKYPCSLNRSKGKRKIPVGSWRIHINRLIEKRMQGRSVPKY